MKAEETVKISWNNRWRNLWIAVSVVVLACFLVVHHIEWLCRLDKISLTPGLESALHTICSFFFPHLVVVMLVYAVVCGIGWCRGPDIARAATGVLTGTVTFTVIMMVALIYTILFETIYEVRGPKVRMKVELNNRKTPDLGYSL